MKVSKFIVEQPGFSDDTVLLYSTLTTSVVEINRDKYEKIFIEKIFVDSSETEELSEMGFLIPDDFDEILFLEDLRRKTLEVNNSSPSYYIICPTTGCNARCYYCFEKGAVQKKMNMVTADAVAEYIISNHDSENLMIQWFGGEPLLEPEIITFISRRLNEKNIKFLSKIITNGYLLTDEIINMGKSEWNLNTIQITIDGLEEEYNRIKNYRYANGNPFKIVIGNIKRALIQGIDVRIRINFNPVEYAKAVETVEFLKNLFSNFSNFFIYLAPIDDDDIVSITDEFDSADKHPLLALLDAQGKYCSFGNYDNRLDKVSDYDAILKKYYLTPVPTSCYGGCKSSLTIDSLGDIFSCHRLLGHKEYASGNVFDGRIDNEIFKYYADPLIVDEECNNCCLLPLCHGGCKYRKFKYGKSKSCTFIKGAYKELIRRAVGELYEL